MACPQLTHGPNREYQLKPGERNTLFRGRSLFGSCTNCGGGTRVSMLGQTAHFTHSAWHCDRHSDTPAFCLKSAFLLYVNRTCLPSLCAATAQAAATGIGRTAFPPKPPPTLRHTAVTLCQGMPRVSATAFWTASRDWVEEVTVKVPASSGRTTAP